MALCYWALRHHGYLALCYGIREVIIALLLALNSTSRPGTDSGTFSSTPHTPINAIQRSHCRTGDHYHHYRLPYHHPHRHPQHPCRSECFFISHGSLYINSVYVSPLSASFSQARGLTSNPPHRLDKTHHHVTISIEVPALEVLLHVVAHLNYEQSRRSCSSRRISSINDVRDIADTEVGNSNHLAPSPYAAVSRQHSGLDETTTEGERKQSRQQFVSIPNEKEMARSLLSPEDDSGKHERLLPSQLIPQWH